MRACLNFVVKNHDYITYASGSNVCFYVIRFPFTFPPSSALKVSRACRSKYVWQQVQVIAKSLDSQQQWPSNFVFYFQSW